MTKTKYFNGLKIATAAVVAITLAFLLGLDSHVSAGIVAILSVGSTKRETMKTASNRFWAFLVALVLSFFCFEGVGYDLNGFYLYLFLFILVCQWKNWQSAMAMNSVLISHFLTFEEMTLPTVINEIALFTIGTSLGICANLHLRENQHFMKELQEEADEQIRTILSRMAQRLVSAPMEDYNGSCFISMKKCLRIATITAEENYMNRLKNPNTWTMNYIAMREKQVQILYSIYKRIEKLTVTPVTAQLISDFLNKLATAYEQGVDLDTLFLEFKELQTSLASSPLPVTRPEFEARAQLYAILGNIEELLLVKYNFLVENPSFSDPSEVFFTKK